MLTLNLTNLAKLKFDHTQYADRLSDYLEKIHTRNQGFYSVIDDEDLVKNIKAFATSVVGKYTDIVVLGIGGSALGTRTLRESLLPIYQQNKPTLRILDNIDPTWVTALREEINIETTLFITVTKSGGTPETLSLYGYFRDQVEKAGLAVKDHFVFVTDPVNSYLRDIANAEGITAFPIPPNVGGRFSVLTAVGLVPAALVGIDLDKLLNGAKKMRDEFLNTNFDQNTVFQLASIQYFLGENGQSNVVMMPYVQQLGTFSEWYKQLLAESTGKINKDGQNVGLTPMSAVGATDQHSQLQQYTQGINDKQFCLIKRSQFDHDAVIPDMGDHAKVHLLNNLPFSTLLNTELRGTADTLTEENRPNYMIEIERVDAETLGQLFMLFEGATAFLGEFYEIDAFNQPGVERSKVLTGKYLAEYKN